MAMVGAEIPTPLREKPQRDRKDTPWQRMSDEEFAGAVDSARGQVIIGLKDSGSREGVDNTGRVVASAAGVAAARQALTGLGITPDYEFPRTPVVVARLSAAQAVALREHPIVDYIEPSLPGEWASQVTPWNVTKVGATTSWGLSTGADVPVLILDSGTPNHRDLEVANQFHCSGGDTLDVVGHATFVAGVVAAVHDDVDVVGVAHGAPLAFSGVLDDTTGKPSAARAACAIDMAKGEGVMVINMSFRVSPYTSLTDQINSAFNYYGMVLVASAGNDTAYVTYPASLSNVIAVTATDSANAKLSGSAAGSEIDLSAPGVDVLSTSRANGTECNPHQTHVDTCTGTSFAAAHVSAAAALLMSRYPAWANTEIRSRLLSTATDLGSTGFDNNFGYGLLNVDKAIKMQVTLVGPTQADSGVQQTYYTIISGGQAPYTFSWAVNGEAAGTGDTLYYTPDDDFNVSVFVIDQYNLGMSAGPLEVTVQACDDECTETLSDGSDGFRGGHALAAIAGSVCAVWFLRPRRSSVRDRRAPGRRA